MQQNYNKNFIYANIRVKKRTYNCTFFRRNFCNIKDIKLKIEKAMFDFFGVPIDYFFRDEEEQKLTESTPVTVYMRTIIDTQKKLIQEQEERIKNLEKIVALREEEMTLYKSK